MAFENTRIYVARRPQGTPTLDDFAAETVTIGDPVEGQVIVAVDTLTIDAWIRTTLNEAGLHTTQDIGGTIRAFGVGQVVESRSEGFTKGDWVFGLLSAQTHALLPADALTKITPEDGIEPKDFVGALGITTGLTAWVGLIAVGEMQPGDTVLVSGAAGAVGSCVVQFAKARGARVIGIAGGPAKCAYLTDEIGADVAIDYKAGGVREAIAAAAPEGIDVFFDNVGGTILDDALDNLAPADARVVICGAISQYQHLDDVDGPKLYLRLAERNASMRGFVVSHHAARFPEAKKEISGWIRNGQVALRDHVVSGIDKFPEALLMLFNGGNTGNLIVRV